ncbi:MAG: glucose-1-phosphate adenylyltransferase [Defluviitaleaceae bacterium]|nr:glucose-1-phosphate adenylyltransferase [Defluviitaleaceae bacterium]
MRGKEIIAMLLAGGQGSRLGILTKTKAKPAVSYGGKFRMIDFPLSNCINSGIDTVGVLTQYQPLLLNKHIGNGVPWDLDRTSGGTAILQPHQKNDNTGDWYSGSANAVCQNINFIDEYNPEYVLVLGGDHIYKMDYSLMLDAHKQNNADATIAVIEVPWDEASRYGIMNADESGRVTAFVEKPKEPVSNLASMGIYIFTWKYLREALIESDKLHTDSDFGKHIIPLLLEGGKTMFAYKFTDYWRDVGTIDSYFESNMELIATVPLFNLYEEHKRIYTNSPHQPPQYTGENADVRGSLLSEGCEIYGTVINSVLGYGVKVHNGARVVNSIVMENCNIGRDTVIEDCILDENSLIGDNVTIGVSVGDDAQAVNELRPDIYNTGITVIGEYSKIPDNVRIGKNCVVEGVSVYSDYDCGLLANGRSVIKPVLM